MCRRRTRYYRRHMDEAFGRRWQSAWGKAEVKIERTIPHTTWQSMLKGEVLRTCK